MREERWYSKTMTFEEHLQQLITLLEQEGRITYRALKRRLNVEDDYLADLTAEIIDAKRLAVDEDGKVLVWLEKRRKGEKEKEINGEGSRESRVQGPESKGQGQIPPIQTLDPRRQTLDVAVERRQLTVMFCDLVGSTALSAQLDPEDYRAVVQGYQQTCAKVIQRHEGYLAQYLGDGLLVYFGYPTAHEDDARRAVRTGLEITTAVAKQVPSLYLETADEIPPVLPFSKGGTQKPPLEKPVLSPVEGGGVRSAGGFGSVEIGRELQVRIGIHTGLVVVGEIGSNEKRELLALGETPNIAARIQGLAEPNTVIVSATTQRLIEGQFESQPFGSHLVKGIDTPIAVHYVQSERQGVSPLARRTTLTPLVGREQEEGLLVDRWEQAKEGRGQVVLLSGEPGIGKSRLTYTLREHVTAEGSLLFEARCSPYYQHSAFYPLIDVLQRTLLFTRQDTDSQKVGKLERTLVLYKLQESFPLFAALLSLPTLAQYAPVNLTPQKQKERTLQALVQLLIAQAERQATVSVWEDLHWVDPSSLEFLSLLIEQIPTTKLLLVLTFRPEFTPPWKPRSHISQLVLNRLGRKQVEAMIEKVATDKALSAEVIEQIRIKTDGVPLFVEELTKSVVESVGATGVGVHGRAPLQLAIPATLQEALLARLDRLSTARQVAQLGATLGREFSHELLQAVSPLSEADLHAALAKLVEAEILYQRGIGQRTRYFFKHALIQDTAYQSLLKSTRQQYHQQIARMLEERFPDTKETQPELLAHHYTEAGLIEQAILYWQQAGERATQRSAYAEAVAHLTKGLEALRALPDAPDHVQQELALQMALGFALTATKGWAAPEVEKAATRALKLCQQLGETPQLFPVLFRLIEFYLNRGKLQTLRELAEQLMRMAQSVQDPYPLSVAHLVLGATLCWLGELPSARQHVEQALVLYDSQTPLGPTNNTADPRRERLTSPKAPWLSYRWASNTADPRIECLAYAVWTLWPLGYADQALKRSQELLALAEGFSQPLGLDYALAIATWCHLLRREAQVAGERAGAVMTLSTEQGFPYFLAWGTMLQGGALVKQEQVKEGVAQIQQGLAIYRTTGAEIAYPYWLALLAEAYGKLGQIEEGLTVLVEALTVVDKTGERTSEAELYRLKGELTLQQFQVSGSKLQVDNLQSTLLNPQLEAEACFLKAIDIAQKQQAKSWELRASTSLARLWQQQGKKTAAHRLLSEVYNWFTEGFDTKDLQEAKELLDSLGSRV